MLEFLGLGLIAGAIYVPFNSRFQQWSFKRQLLRELTEKDCIKIEALYAQLQTMQWDYSHYKDFLKKQPRRIAIEALKLRIARDFTPATENTQAEAQTQRERYSGFDIALANLHASETTRRKAVSQKNSAVEQAEDAFYRHLDIEDGAKRLLRKLMSEV